MDGDIKTDTAKDQLPAECSKCKRPLCLRQKVMNLTVGNVDELFCLECLGQESDRKAVEVLLTLKGYALSRECFSKEWRRYTTVDDCPDRLGCCPEQCFSQP